MKPYVFFAYSIGLILGACSDEKEEPNYVPLRHYLEDTSYIQGYTYGDPKLAYFDGIRDDRDLVSMTVTADSCCMSPYYYSVNYPGTQQSVEKTERFLATAEENGDLHYTGWVGGWDIAFAKHIREIHLSSDREWDAAHPAGSSLNDLFFFNGCCYGSFLNNGYSDADSSKIGRICKIDCLSPDDLYITGDFFSCNYGPTVVRYSERR